MLAAGLAQSHPAELGFLAEDAHILETLGANGLGVGSVLHEQRQILGQQLLRRIVPMVEMGMGDDHRIDTLDQVVGGKRKLDQGIAQITAIGVLESRVAAFFGQHGIDKEGGIGVADLYRGIADLLHLYRGAGRGG
ncbi:hypothetical protein FQZ97_1182840 [compost metagenome]